MNEPNRILAIWIQNRLGEREAVAWAVRAIERVGRHFGQDIVDLLDFLDEQAERDESLSNNLKLTWRMLRVAAHERQRREEWWEIERYKQAIDTGRFRVENIQRLVDFVRPRLVANEASSYNLEESNDGTDDPRRWVFWDFEASCGALDHGVSKLDAKFLAKLSAETLASMIEASTTSLDRAINIAREIGWIDVREDLARFVSHVAIPLGDDSQDEKEAGDRDPDAYNDDFVPVIRFMSAAFDALATKDAVVAKRIVNRWADQSESLYLRLVAYATWNPLIRTGEDAGRLLEAADERAFWNVNMFPEIAGLRALRWRDLPVNARRRLWQHGYPKARAATPFTVTARQQKRLSTRETWSWPGSLTNAWTHPMTSRPP